MHRFGEKLRMARRKARLTQQRVADELQIDRVTVARYEAGKERPRLLLGCRLAKLLRVHVFWLVGLVDNPLPGVQTDTQLEAENYEKYLKMDQDERRAFAEMMADFMRARELTHGGKPKSTGREKSV